MRIAVLTNILTPYRVPFFEALAKRASDFSVLLMARSHDSRAWSLPDARFSVTLLPGVHWHPPGWYEPLHINYGTDRALRQYRPDVVLNGAYTFASFVAYRACRRLRSHHVPWGELTLRDGAERSWVRRQLRRTMISGSSGCIASSLVSRDAFIHYGMTPDRVLHATMPVQTAYFAEAAAQIHAGRHNEITRAFYGKPLVLAVGQLVDRKGIPELLVAMQTVQRSWPAVTLAVAGDGPQRSEYQQRARELGLKDVRFLGFVKPDELARLYTAADAFVFPTRFDTFGAVVAEAMAAGAIVVSSVHAAATQDLIVDGETGFSVNPDDPMQLAAGIAGALELTGRERSAMSVRAAGRACANSFSSTADAVMEFLQRLPPLKRQPSATTAARSGDARTST